MLELVDHNTGNTRDELTRPEAEDARERMIELGANPGDLEIRPMQGAETDGGPEVVDDPGEEFKPDAEPTEDYSDTLPDQGPSVDEDPLVWMPDEFTDTIDGTVAINRKGFEVLAHHYSIQCQTSLCEPLTDGDRVVFKAVATDSDGDTYSAYGSASEDRGDDPGLVVEMADTRAYKRAISRATGVGMVAVEELQEGFNNE